YNYAMESGLLPEGRNPFNNCTVQRDRKKKRTLTRSQLTRLYLIMQQAEIESNRRIFGRGGRSALYPVWFWITVLDTLRYTGMRQNQLLHVQLRDVNLTEGYIDLRLEGSKTHREWRVPVVRQLRLRLQLLLSRATEAGAGPKDNLFDVSFYIAGRKAKFERNDVSVMHQKIRSFFRRLSKECGFAVSPHRFRHTLATELMKAPERNLQLVKDLLGHRSVSTTMEYVELRMDIVGKTLEEELSLHTDLCVERELQLLTQN
ncbi:TPA: site-specific integrase, partial [Klebsiella pneumoniae]|nr:site-specific integrase [Klebsiella pneumoniae]HBY0117536.1 site-specific integrase [Klebsiella pneumoniae]